MKAEALNCKIKELKLKENEEKKMVSFEDYHKLKAHLVALNERHKAFRSRILNENNFGITEPQTHQVSLNYCLAPVPNLNLNDENDLISTKFKGKNLDSIFLSPNSNAADKIIEEVVI